MERSRISWHKGVLPGLKPGKGIKYKYTTREERQHRRPVSDGYVEKENERKEETLTF
jgi:hypothetical protein